MFLYFYIIHLLIYIIRVEGDGEKEFLWKFRDFLAESDLARADISFIERDPKEIRKCSHLNQNQMSPYVVIFLYKTSGNFLGMGGIINKKAVVTADSVIRKSFSTPKDLLVLAGYLSPWWGRHSEIRTATEVYPKNYELVLVEVKPFFRFNDHVQPIKIKDANIFPDSRYENDYLMFGIHTDKTFAPGDQIRKDLIYHAIKHTPTEKNDCGSDYKDLIPKFNDTVHYCFSPNGSFCAGCVGSPVVGTVKPSVSDRLVGIVVRSECSLENQRVLVVKLPAFRDLILAQKYLAFEATE